jgi:anti-sigma factor (TIGR02949 family)
MGASECRDLESLLQPYVDGEFEPSDRADLEVHLAHCDHCRALVEHERRFRERVRQAAFVPAPQALRERIDLGLRRERKWASAHAVFKSAAWVAVAACAGFIGYLELPDLLEPLLRDAVTTHSRSLPVEVQGDEQRVMNWFRGKVDFNVQLPHFRNVSLEGARLSHIRDHNAAYVVYGGPNARRVSLFVFDDPHAQLELGLNPRRTRIADREVVLGQARGYNVAVWRDNEIVYSLVSDLDERDIVNLLDGRAPVGEPALPPVLTDPGSGMPQIAPAALHANP